MWAFGLRCLYTTAAAAALGAAPRGKAAEIKKRVSSGDLILIQLETKCNLLSNGVLIVQ